MIGRPVDFCVRIIAGRMPRRGPTCQPRASPWITRHPIQESPARATQHRNTPYGVFNKHRAPQRRAVSLFPPMLRPIQRVRTNDSSPYTTDHALAQLLNHPGGGVFFRDGVRSFKSKSPGRLEAVPGVVAGVAEDEDESDIPFLQQPQPLFDQFSADTFPLYRRDDRERSENRGGGCTFGVRAVDYPNHSEQDMPPPALRPHRRVTTAGAPPSDREAARPRASPPCRGRRPRFRRGEWRRGLLRRLL